MLPPRSNSSTEDLERLAQRAHRNMAFRRRIEPLRRTQPGELEHWMGRIRTAIRHRDKAQPA